MGLIRKITDMLDRTFPEICRKCGHWRASHAITFDGYACARCKCRRRFWR